MVKLYRKIIKFHFLKEILALQFNVFFVYVSFLVLYSLLSLHHPYCHSQFKVLRAKTLVWSFKRGADSLDSLNIVWPDPCY